MLGNVHQGNHQSPYTVITMLSTLFLTCTFHPRDLVYNANLYLLNPSPINHACKQVLDNGMRPTKLFSSLGSRDCTPKFF